MLKLSKVPYLFKHTNKMAILQSIILPLLEMNNIYTHTRRLCAKLLGFVLLASGVLKLMDPVGTSLIVKEYYNFLHIVFMSGTSLVVGEILALIEALSGVFLVSGVFRKVISVIVTALMGGFTILTLFLWIFNPPMDCGCFGEAVHLTHFQSFIKNIVLTALALYSFIPYDSQGSPRKIKYVGSAIVSVSVVAFAIYSLLYIPLLELTPFNLSSKLAASVEMPESTEDMYTATFIYEKNGKQGVFTLDKLPDSTWTFVETRTIMKQDNIRETEYPYLSFKDADGNYRDSLAAKGNVIVVSVPDPKGMSLSDWERASSIVADARLAGLTSIVLVAGTKESVLENWAESLLGEDKIETINDVLYYSDYKTLISLNRSNGGVVHFSRGNLIRKWAARSAPDAKELKYIADSDKTELMLIADSRSRLAFQAFALYAVAILLLF